MARPLTIENFVISNWPKLREVYVSPLSRGDDAITSWQVELQIAGSFSKTYTGPTVDAALEEAIKFGWTRPA